MCDYKVLYLLQLGGPDGEMAAALRYLSQRYTMPWTEMRALLTDIGTEELAHVEIISAILYQLTDGLDVEELKDAGMDDYFVDHTLGIYPQSASGVPFTCAYFQSKGDPITDLTEDMAADGATMEEQHSWKTLKTRCLCKTSLFLLRVHKNKQTEKKKMKQAILHNFNGF